MICTSVWLRASTRVSSGFAPLRHSSPSFGSRQACSHSNPSQKIKTPWSVFQDGVNGEPAGRCRERAGPGLGRRRNPHRSTPRADRRTGSRRSASDRGASPAPIRFPPDNFKHSLTLFSKSFSSFPRGLCLLSVSRPYLALDGIYRPIWAAFPNNPTRRQRLVVRQGPGVTGLSPSLAPLSRGLRPGSPLRTLLQTTIRTPGAPDFQAGLFPVRSLLLRESCAACAELQGRRFHTWRSGARWELERLCFTTDRRGFGRRGLIFGPIVSGQCTGGQSLPAPWGPRLGLGGWGGATMCDTQADVPSAKWLGAQLAFKELMVHEILQFTPSIAFRYVLHRCESRDIHCRESFWIHVKEGAAPHGAPSPGPRERALSLDFLGAVRIGGSLFRQPGAGRVPLPAAWGGKEERPQRTRSPSRRRFGGLLATSQAANHPRRRDPNTSPDHSIELTRQIAPPTKNGHAPPPIESRKSSQSVNPYYVWTCGVLKVTSADPWSASFMVETRTGRNLNDASPARWPCDRSSYHESSEQRAEPASTFYLINASPPEVGDQPGSTPSRCRHPPDLSLTGPRSGPRSVGQDGCGGRSRQETMRVAWTIEAKTSRPCTTFRIQENGQRLRGPRRPSAAQDTKRTLKSTAALGERLKQMAFEQFGARAWSLPTDALQSPLTRPSVHLPSGLRKHQARLSQHRRMQKAIHIYFFRRNKVVGMLPE
ncbi:hypothetical protein KPL71_023640 [Citrus sinensis]|uniref:Uncharacterized protein n=1 Tax=Citrus sinensis TaxID=2711 RepID=A0ACB8ILE0_CITSI|nr:hypothetical protein KPL71_023640 [Citrus sinensis]